MLALVSIKEEEAEEDMEKKKTFIISTVSKRAWRLFRTAFSVWIRKGGAFKRSLLLPLKLSGAAGQHNRLHYFEREFSFNEYETPSSFRFNLHRRPHIPCINNPPPDFYYSEDDQDHASSNNTAAAINVFFNNNGYINVDHDHDHDLIDQEEYYCNIQEGKGKGEEEDGDDEQVDHEQEIDSKAEEFIAKFYQEIKFQRQVSLIQYNEMLHRSIS